ncbi:hypothetical protein ACFRCG_07690 [Embleya sp. NPDC056575]|uniref:hypothetical protein n=1 Tax=unclassified Embleya TaxID=2699296 RepID=UPI0036A8E555
MRMRLRPRAALAVTAGALALSLVDLSAATAAPGVVVMYRLGQEKAVSDPQAEQCQPGLGAGTTISNRTEGTILLFPDGNCQTKVYDPLEPDQTRTTRVGSFMALD